MLEDSKNVLIRAQIDFWMEMVHLNKDRVGSEMLQEMQRHLAQARQELIAVSGSELRLAA
jgi:hypothetical protein